MSTEATSSVVPNAQVFPAFYPGKSQNVAIGASSVQCTDAFLALTSLVRVYVDLDAIIAIGPNPTAASPGCVHAAGLTDYYAANPGDKIAVIALNGGTGTLNVTEGA